MNGSKKVAAVLRKKANEKTAQTNGSELVAKLLGKAGVEKTASEDMEKLAENQYWFGRIIGAGIADEMALRKEAASAGDILNRASGALNRAGGTFHRVRGNLGSYLRQYTGAGADIAKERGSQAGQFLSRGKKDLGRIPALMKLRSSSKSMGRKNPLRHSLDVGDFNTKAMGTVLGLGAVGAGGAGYAGYRGYRALSDRD